MDTTFEQKEFDGFLRSSAYSGDFPTLWRFPKEFKRNWFKQLDARFMIILSLTFLFEVSMILFLLSGIKGNDKNLDVNSIQKRYAYLLLNKHSEDAFFNETGPTGTYLHGIPEEIERNTLLSGSKQNIIKNVISVHANNSPGSGSNRDQRVRSNPDREFSNRTSDSYSGGTTKRVGSIGLLQYISDDNNASNEDLREIFAQGDRNNQFLEGSLANVKLGDYTKQGAPAQSGSSAESATLFSGLKGAKSDVSTAELRSSVAPLEKAIYSTVVKNTELEESSASILNKTGSKASARKAEHVTRIVLNHNRSIQDCYKQALKKQPGIKGKVVVRFSVTPGGVVDHVEIIRSTINYEPMVNCIVNRIRRWNDFGESDISLGTVSYRQTYVFGY